MKNIFKKTMALFMAVALVCTGVYVSPSGAEAADTNETITSVVFNITASEATTFTYATNYGGWNQPTIDIASGTADYTLADTDFTSIYNMGYIDASNSVTATINSITINGYKFVPDGTLLAGSLDADGNCIWECWSRPTGTIYSEDGAAYLSLQAQDDGGATLYLVEEEEDEEEEEVELYGWAILNANTDNYAINCWDWTDWANTTYNDDWSINERVYYNGVEIDGYDTYTVSLSGDQVTYTDTFTYVENDGPAYLAVKISDIGANYGTAFTVENIVVEADGEALTVDEDAVVISVDEDDTTLLITIVDPWTEKTNAIAEAEEGFTIAESIAVTFELAEVTPSSEDPETPTTITPATEDEEEGDETTASTAYIGIASSNWSISAWRGSIYAGSSESTYEGAAIKDGVYGTYTVDFDVDLYSGISDMDFESALVVDISGIATTLELDSDNVTTDLIVSDVVVLIDGKEVEIDQDAISWQIGDTADEVRINLYSTWCNPNVDVFTSGDHTFTDSIEITFTLAAATEAEADDPTEEETKNDDSDKEDETPSPKTGDATFVIFMVSIIALAGAAFTMKKAR